MNGNSNGNQQKSSTQGSVTPSSNGKASKKEILENAEEQLLQAEEQYTLMTDDEGASSGAFIIIAAVVIVGMVAAFVFMRYMLNQSKIRMVEQANERHQKIKDLDGPGGLELMNAKTKKGMDHLKGDSDGAKIVNHETDNNVGEYEDQYNANHDFAIF